MVYWGQPIGAVVAESREQATHAAEKVRIEYEEMPPVLTIEVSILFINYNHSYSNIIITSQNHSRFAITLITMLLPDYELENFIANEFQLNVFLYF